MRVLLLSNNRTVQEMIILALRDIPGFELVLARETGQMGAGDFDVLLVDDAMPLYRESLALAERLGAPKTVLLYQEAGRDDHAFDHRIKKPFLPSEIRQIVARYVSEERDKTAPITEEEPAGKKIEKRAPNKKKKKSKSGRKKETKYRAETEVLNLDEIETIKALLEEDGLEIVREEELADKMLKEHNRAENSRQDALIDALRTMRPRDIRKLLKGAKMRVEITFPGGDT